MLDVDMLVRLKPDTKEIPNSVIQFNLVSLPGRIVAHTADISLVYWTNYNRTDVQEWIDDEKLEVVNQDEHYGYQVKLACNNITKLRSVDVYRVLENANDPRGLGKWITEKRKDLKYEVTGVLVELGLWEKE